MAKVQNSQSPKPEIGNQKVAEALAPFDYRNLIDEAWDNYLDLTIGKLKDPRNKLESRKNPRAGGFGINDMFDYEGYSVAAVKKELYPGMKDTPNYIAGIKLMREQPTITTRITAGRAKLLNEQLDAYNEAMPGTYYLIKKVSVTQE